MKKETLTLILFAIIILGSITFCWGQNKYLLKADRVFDGTAMHNDWVILVEGDKITGVGTEKQINTNGAEVINLPGATLLPGLIEGHSHILLHPYNETLWNDQVLKESEAERVVRATVHARNTLLAGFTTIRDLGTEGAGFADVGIKQAIEKGVIPGPRMIIATKAIVATGSYGPKGFAPHVNPPLGAEAADGHDDIIKVVRNQIGKGADFIKVYADYRWGPDGEAQPSFSLDELKLIVETAKSSGRYVVAHAATAEGMRRATLAGVETIEHGDGATEEALKLMKDNNVALCPTIAAGDAISQYFGGWKKGTETEPERIINKRKSFKMALSIGVKICAGSDVGVFPHGENARELELMVDYGMKPLDVLQSVTSGNAEIMHLKNRGSIKVGLLADIIAVEGNPVNDITTLRNVQLVMKNGVIYKRP